jgi:hypothetical protein
MTQDEKRIKIAEACGWIFNPPPYREPPFSSGFKAEALLCWVRPGNMSHQTESPPDYFNDLNACHEAEKILSIHQLNQMNDILWDLIEMKQHAWQASAAQRAEAFGKTLNLW